MAALLQPPRTSAEPGLREDAPFLLLYISGGLCWPRRHPKDRSIPLLVFSKMPETSCPHVSLSLRTFAKPGGLTRASPALTRHTGGQVAASPGRWPPSHPTFPQWVRSVLRVRAWLPVTVYFSSPICAHGHHRTRHQHQNSLGAQPLGDTRLGSLVFETVAVLALGTQPCSVCLMLLLETVLEGHGCVPVSQRATRSSPSMPPSFLRPFPTGRR